MRKSSAFAWLPRPQFRLRTLLMLPVIFALVAAWWRWPRTYRETSTEDYEVEIPEGVYLCSHARMAAAQPTKVKWPIIAEVCRATWQNFGLRTSDNVLPNDVVATFTAVFDWQLKRRLQGPCRLTDTLGHLVAEGSFDQDLPHGKWTFWNHRDGDWRLEGEFDHDQAIGVWKAALADDLVVREFDVSQLKSDEEAADPVLMTERIGGNRFELQNHSVKGHYRRGFDTNGKLISEESFYQPIFESLDITTSDVPAVSVGLYPDGSSRFEETFGKDFATNWEARVFDGRGVMKGTYRLTRAGIELLDKKPAGFKLHKQRFFGAHHRVYMKLPHPSVRRLAALWSMQIGVPILVHPVIIDQEWPHVRFDNSDDMPDWLPFDVAAEVLETLGLAFEMRFERIWLTTRAERDRWTDQTGVSEMPHLEPDYAALMLDCYRPYVLPGGLTLTETARCLELSGSHPIEIRGLKEIDATVRSPYGLETLRLPDALSVICEMWQLKVKRDGKLLVLQPRCMP